MRDLQIEPIPGNVPDLANLPAGCAFAPRCQHRQNQCEDGPVPLVSAGDGRLSRCLVHLDFQRDVAWNWDDIVSV